MLPACPYMAEDSKTLSIRKDLRTGRRKVCAPQWRRAGTAVPPVPLLPLAYCNRSCLLLSAAAAEIADPAAPFTLNRALPNFKSLAGTRAALLTAAGERLKVQERYL